MKICRTTRTLADVQTAVRLALKTAKGINEGVYTQLDAYLELIVPEIRRASLADRLALHPGSVNVMDLSGYATPMQMLFVQSALDWINERETNTIVVVPEAWEFIPEGKASPAKASAVTLVRKGAAIGNRIWVDSQDMAGVDKVILRGCAVWIIGVQRESNEIRRNLANIPASIKRPSAAAVAQLERGQFFVCWGQHAIKTYVQPSWMTDAWAERVARGEISADEAAGAKPNQQRQDDDMARTDELERENERLREENQHLVSRLDALQKGTAASSNDTARADGREAGHRVNGNDGPTSSGADREWSASETLANEALYQAIKARLIKEAPSVIRILAQRPEILLEVERDVISMDAKTLRGRVARLIHQGWFDEPKTTSAARRELARTGADPGGGGSLSETLAELVRLGFLTREVGGFKATTGAVVNIVER